MAGGAAALVSFIGGDVIGAAHGVWAVVGSVVLLGVAALPAAMGVPS